MNRRWISYADRRVANLCIVGWIGARQSGYYNEFKAAIRRLNRHSRTVAFEDVFKDMALSRGYGDFCLQVLPAMRLPHVADSDCISEVWHDCHL